LHLARATRAWCRESRVNFAFHKSHDPGLPRWREMAMTSDRIIRVEAAVQDLLRRDDAPAAANLLIVEHGADVFGLLLAVLDNPSIARRVYVTLCERAASELSQFDWKCALHVWLYALARRILREQRDEERTLAATESDMRIKDLVAEVVANVRRVLSPDERALLILRVDRGFEWEQLAITELDVQPADVAAGAQVIRDRYENLLRRIRHLATRELEPE
jgi:hypothetical protein